MSVALQVCVCVFRIVSADNILCVLNIIIIYSRRCENLQHKLLVLGYATDSRGCTCLCVLTGTERCRLPAVQPAGLCYQHVCDNMLQEGVDHLFYNCSCWTNHGQVWLYSPMCV